MIRILLAEDQALVRDGLSVLLQMEDDFSVEAVANGEEALAAARREPPDIAILDVRMPVMDGVECTRKLKAEHPRLPVLILTTFDDRALVQACLDAGASAYLLKDIEPEALTSAIRLLLAGERLIPGDLARELLDGAADGGGDAPRRALAEADADDELVEPLTPRQQEVLRLIADGLTNREIAERLFLSEGTVKNTVSEIYARLRVRDRVQAVLKMLGNNPGLSGGG